MQTQARVREISTSQGGSFMTAPHIIGDTVLELDDVSVFSDQGGQVTIAGNVYAYSTVDYIVNTIFLSSGLLTDHPAQGTGPDDPPIEGVPVRVYPDADEKIAMMLLTTDETQAEQLIPAVVDHSLKDQLVDIRYEGDEGPYATIDDSSGRWVLTQIHGFKSVLDSALLYGPITLPPDTPPGSSPTPTVAALGVGTITWSVTPVAGVGIRYRVYSEAFASPPGAVTQDAAHLVYDGSSPMGTFDSINGAPLIPDAADSTTVLPTYYVQVMAYNTGGDAPAASAVSSGVTPRRAGQKEFSSDIIYANRVELHQVQGGRADFQFIVGHEVTTDVPGTDRVVMDPTGIYSELTSGERMFDIPVGGSPTFRGILESDSALFTDGVELRGTSELAPNSSTQLDASLTSPNTAPIVSQNRLGMDLDYSGFVPAGADTTQPRLVSNPWWDSTASLWRIATGWHTTGNVNTGGIDSYFVAIHSFSAAGVLSVANCLETAGGFWPTGINAFRGFFMLGGKYFVGVNPTAGGTTYLQMFNATTGVYEDSEQSTLHGSNPNGVCYGTDGTDLWLGKINVTAGLPDGFTTTNLPANIMYALRRPITITGATFTLGTINKRVRLGQGVKVDPGSSAALKNISASRTAGAAAFDYPVSTNNFYLNLTTAPGSAYGFDQSDASFTVGTAAEVTATFVAAWYGEKMGHGFNSTSGYFWAMQSSGRRMTRYAHNLLGGVVFDFAYTWSDDDATGGRHETLISPVASPTLFSRNDITIQSAALPAASVPPTTDDVNGVRFYIRNRLAGASLTRTWRVGTGNGHQTGTPGSPVTSASVETQLPANADAPAYSVDTGLTRAPTSNSFTSSTLLTPHIIFTESGNMQLKGDGTGSWPLQDQAWTAQVAQTGVANATSTTNVTLASVSQAVTSPGTSAVYLVSLDASVSIGIANSFNTIELLLDGVGVTPTLITRGPVSMVVPAHRTWRITGLSAGSHTFTARTRNSAASTDVDVSSTLLTVERKA